MIRKITGEPVSHVAIRMRGIVTHSNFLGVHTEWHEDFYKHSTIRYFVPIRDLDNVRLWASLLTAQRKPYDFGAMFYLGLRYLFPKWMPKQNLWQSSGAYMCTEFVTYVLKGEPDSMITPYQLYQQLRGELKNE